MKKLAIVLAASFLASAAYAQSSTTVIQKEGVDSGTVVKERTVGTTSPTVVKKRVVSTGSTGCKSKTVQKTDEMGDTSTKQKVKC